MIPIFILLTGQASFLVSFSGAAPPLGVASSTRGTSNQRIQQLNTARNERLLSLARTVILPIAVGTVVGWTGGACMEVGAHVSQGDESVTKNFENYGAGVGAALGAACSAVYNLLVQCSTRSAPRDTWVLPQRVVQAVRESGVPVRENAEAIVENTLRENQQDLAGPNNNVPRQRDIEMGHGGH